MINIYVKLRKEIDTMSVKDAKRWEEIFYQLALMTGDEAFMALAEDAQSHAWLLSEDELYEEFQAN